MGALQPDFLLAPADSGAVIVQVYSVSLLATVPIAIAALVALAVRGRSAAVRALVWRAAVVALLALYAGQLLPAAWEAWLVPAGLAEPLVALGRLRVSAASLTGAVLPAGADATLAPRDTLAVVRILTAVYCAGAAIVLLPLVRGIVATRRIAREATPLGGTRWGDLLRSAQRALAMDRRVALLGSTRVLVPVTFGTRRPTVVLPMDAAGWDDARLRAVLVHELAHVRAHDVAFAIAARFACALLWFHPAVWRIARALHDACEQACDDRVIAGGVRRSDYAELLVEVAERLRCGRAASLSSPAAALAGSGLRGRLAALLRDRDRRELPRAAVAVAMVATLALTAPLAAVQLAPTRDVLHRLLRDARWESRAYAVVGLAPRADSVAVARAASLLDPSPRVRAWAAWALDHRATVGSPATPAPRLTPPVPAPH